MNKLEKNYEELEKSWSPAIQLYIDYFFMTNKKNSSSYYKLNDLKKFLDFYATENLNKTVDEITMEDLEHIPLNTVSKYLDSLKLKPNGKKQFIKILKSFWNYYTVASFSVEKKAPHFYRNVMNEWQVVYGMNSITKSKKNSVENDYVESYDLQTMLNFLDMVDNSLSLYFSSQAKVDNWNKNKDRDLAIVALLAATGVDIEQLAQASYRDIDLRKKTLVVTNSQGQLIKKDILSEFIPYISPYLSTRRKWWAADSTVGSLFLNFRKQGLSSQGIASAIHRIAKVSGKPLSAMILKQTHAVLVFKNNNKLSELTETESRRLTRVVKKGKGE